MQAKSAQLIPLKSTYTMQRRHKWLLILLLIAVAAALIWKFKFSAAASPTATTASEAVVFELADSDVATISVRDLGVNLPIAGSLIPLNNITVKSKVTAVVNQTMVQEGVNVSQGEVLMKFDDADLSARLATQEAAVEMSMAKLALAKKNRDTNHALFEQKFISQNADDTAENNLALAQADLKSILSLRQIARLALADTVVHAPLSGIVSKRLVQVGEKVSPDTPLFSIVNLAKLTLEAEVPASEIPRIKLGQKVSFSVDGFSGREFIGNVLRINPNAETGTRSFMVYVEVANADGALRGGMFAKGQLTLANSPKATVVPLIAVHTFAGVPTVYKIDHGTVVAQPVKLGLRNDDEGTAQVLDGLTNGEKVIISQLDMIKPGSKVSLAAHAAASKVVPAAATPTATPTATKG